jgi:hypothetical protein
MTELRAGQKEGRSQVAGDAGQGLTGSGCGVSKLRFDVESE